MTATSAASAPMSDSSTTAEPSGRSWRTGTRPSQSSACQAKWRAWRASRSFAPAGAMRGTQAPSIAGELQLERPGALDAIGPLDDPDLRRHATHEREHCHAPDSSGGTERRGQNSETAMPARIATAPASRPAPSRSPLTYPAMPGEHRLGQEDQRGARRGDPLLAPQLQRQRDRGARDAGEHDRERPRARSASRRPACGRRRDRQSTATMPICMAPNCSGRSTCRVRADVDDVPTRTARRTRA